MDFYTPGKTVRKSKRHKKGEWFGRLCTLGRNRTRQTFRLLKARGPWGGSRAGREAKLVVQRAAFAPGFLFDSHGGLGVGRGLHGGTCLFRLTGVPFTLVPRAGLEGGVESAGEEVVSRPKGVGP